MKVYSATNEQTKEGFISTSGANIAGFVGCHPDYLRRKLRTAPLLKVKGFVVYCCELDRITGRGEYLRNNRP